MRKSYKVITLLLMCMAASFLFGKLTNNTAMADERTIYKDGIYCYDITDEKNKEVNLIGVEQKDVIKELVIPGTAAINGTEYQVARVNIDYQYYTNDAYADFYQNVEKLTIAENFTGTLQNLTYPFNKVRTVEFKGINPPKAAYFELTNSRDKLDLLFVVPQGTEKAYAGVIEEAMQYSTLSDLYEHSIPMVPTIVSNSNDSVEEGCFSYDNYIFQVTKSAKEGTGAVQLIGLKKARQSTYLSLPKSVTNNGYSYQLTKLSSMSLVYSGARAIVVPDSVVEMETAVFDKTVELLFLSKNCKTLPKYLITDENMESNLRFVHVPEGVTTISENAFYVSGENKASIILPSTIKSLGKKSLNLFKTVTFLNNQPISNSKAAIAAGTTVKVNTSSIKKYKAVLGSKISVIAAKKVVKTSVLTTADNKLILNFKQSVTEKASLSNYSNETIFWLSTDPAVVTVSSKDVITGKSTGTAYVLAYTRTSGRYKAIQVTVSK